MIKQQLQQWCVLDCTWWISFIYGRSCRSAWKRKCRISWEADAISVMKAHLCCSEEKIRLVRKHYIMTGCALVARYWHAKALLPLKTSSTMVRPRIIIFVHEKYGLLPPLYVGKYDQVLLFFMVCKILRRSKVCLSMPAFMRYETNSTSLAYQKRVSLF